MKSNVAMQADRASARLLTNLKGTHTEARRFIEVHSARSK